MAKELIETARGQDYVMKYKFVADHKDNKIVWHNEGERMARGKNVVQSVSTYVNVHDIAGEVVHSHQVFLYPEEIKKIYTRLMELEANEVTASPEDELPFQ